MKLFDFGSFSMKANPYLKMCSNQHDYGFSLKLLVLSFEEHSENPSSNCYNLESNHAHSTAVSISVAAFYLAAFGDGYHDLHFL